VNADNEIDSSIDFSKKNLAFKVSSYESFESLVFSLLDGVGERRFDKEYFSSNKHLLPPYGYDEISNFVGRL
jgi:hypothetical protein